MSNTSPLLELIQVCKSFPAPTSGGEVLVLRDINLQMKAGDSAAVVGPSGSGKSTLLNIIGTLDRPSSGKVLIAGRNVAELDDLALAGVRSTEIGFIFQSHHLLPHCTVFENILVPTLAGKGTADRGAAAERARKLLDRVGLSHRLDHRPGQLSGGERQRVAVVRALINRPKLVLADEPTGALDRASATSLGQLLVELNREEGVALLTVTHSPELAGLMGRTLTLSDGTFV